MKARSASKRLQLTARLHGSYVIFSAQLNADRAPQLKASVGLLLGGRLSFMKYLLILSSSLLLVNALSCGKAVQRPRQERSEFASRIGSILPQTWALQDSGEEVIISRQEPVTWYPCVALDANLMRHQDLMKQFIERHGASGKYRIRLRRADRLEPAAYARIKASNDQIVVTKSTIMPKGEFLEDEAIRSFDSRYRELPEYYDDSSSIYVETTAAPYECIYPNSVAKECDTMRQKLDSLFSRYSKDTLMY